MTLPNMNNVRSSTQAFTLDPTESCLKSVVSRTALAEVNEDIWLPHIEVSADFRFASTDAVAEFAQSL